MIERELLSFPLEGKGVEAEMKTFNEKFTERRAFFLADSVDRLVRSC